MRTFLTTILLGVLFGCGGRVESTNDDGRESATDDGVYCSVGQGVVAPGDGSRGYVQKCTPAYPTCMIPPGADLYTCCAGDPANPSCP